MERENNLEIFVLAILRKDVKTAYDKFLEIRNYPFSFYTGLMTGDGTMESIYKHIDTIGEMAKEILKMKYLNDIEKEEIPDKPSLVDMLVMSLFITIAFASYMKVDRKEIEEMIYRIISIFHRRLDHEWE